MKPFQLYWDTYRQDIVIFDGFVFSVLVQKIGDMLQWLEWHDWPTDNNVYINSERYILLFELEQ